MVARGVVSVTGAPTVWRRCLSLIISPMVELPGPGSGRSVRPSCGAAYAELWSCVVTHGCGAEGWRGQHCAPAHSQAQYW